MPNFLISYLGGEHPSDPQEGKAHFAKYQAWLKSLGEQAVSPANPLKHTHIVHSNGEVSQGGITNMSGYTIVSAESIEEAIRIAKACPFLDIKGNLEVSELVAM